MSAGVWEDIRIGSQPAPNRTIYSPGLEYTFQKHLWQEGLKLTFQPEKLPPREDCQHTRSVYKHGKWMCSDCYTTL